MELNENYIQPDLLSNYFSIQENDLLNGTIKQVQLNKIKRYSPSEVQNALAELNSLNMEYKYINGECHNRSHLGGLYLSKLGYDIFKIWNFSPSLYSIISNKTLVLKDTLGIQKDIKSEFHVALGIVQNKDKVFSAMVLDPSFSNYPQTIEHWRSHQNCKNAIFLFSDYKDYLFNTLNGLKIFNNKYYPNESIQLPKWFPKVLTGDFFRYENIAKEQKWIPKGLATSDVAFLIYQNFKIQKKIDKNVELLKDINLLRKNLEEKTINIKFFDFWQQRIDFWDIKLNECE